MLLPRNAGAARDGQHGMLLRRLCCRRGTALCKMQLAPRDNFAAGPVTSPVPGGLELRVAGLAFGLWTSRPVDPNLDGASASFKLAAGEEFWAILGLANNPAMWNLEVADEALRATIWHWRDWSGRYSYQGLRKDRVIRSALAIELLSYEPTGALAAAVTSSLPERIGGDRNYDYRYAWIRDASMAIATLSVLGDLKSAERYLTWLTGLGSSTEMPLQVLYRVGGGTNIEQHVREELSGYRDFASVRFGNHAYRQRQIDCFGYLADCAVIYLLQGGRWRPEHGN